jgi:hypothetical protein
MCTQQGTTAMTPRRHHQNRSLIEDSYDNIFNHLLIKVDGDQTKPPAPSNKQIYVPSISAHVVFESRSVDDYATPIYASSNKAACIDPRDLIDLLLPRAFNDILPPVNASTPGLWTPRHDETDGYLTKDTRISLCDEHRHLACY